MKAKMQPQAKQSRGVPIERTMYHLLWSEINPQLHLSPIYTERLTAFRNGEAKVKARERLSQILENRDASCLPLTAILLQSVRIKTWTPVKRLSAKKK